MAGSDTTGLKQLYGRLCEEDLYRRFFSNRPPPDAFIEKMARVSERGGFGVVAALSGEGSDERIVAEASFAPLSATDAEVGITVEASARGWLGPYLLDVLVEEARLRGIANLQAEVLSTNRQMQALLEARGSAVIDHSDRPAIVRLCIGTAGRSPAWSGPPERPRLLVEVPGGRWRAAGAARRAGFQVLACPGVRRRFTRCPALAGEPCPLAAGADVIVDALRDEAGRSLLEAHHRLHPSVPVCIDAGRPRSGTDAPALEGLEGTPVLYSDMDDAAVVGVLQGLLATGVDLTFHPIDESGDGLGMSPGTGASAMSS